MQPSSTMSYASWRRIFLTVHLMAAAGLGGAAATLIGLGVSGLRGADPRSVFPPAHPVDAWLVVPLAVLTLGSGIVQVVAGSWSMTSDRWVTIKLLSTVVAGLAVALVLEPRLAKLAESAWAGEPFTAGQFLPLTIGPSVAVLLVGVSVALGLVRPGSRRSLERMQR